jgi:DNA-binding winged helix-turn-helix (wHTH) protein/tetratricopeptide (TPR) repeat protein
MSWAFGEFELDEKLFQLRRAGAPVALRRKPLQLLLYLAQNATRVVPTAELLKTVWPGVKVTEVSLRQTVRALRVALGSDVGKTLVSVRGHGYRLQVPVIYRPTVATTGRREQPLGGPADEAPRRSFFGRDSELDQILNAAREATGGHGQLVVVTGAPGLGKTRLAQEVAAVVPSSMRVVWGRCWEEGGSQPFWPWDAVMRGIIGGERAGSPDFSELLLESGAGDANDGASQDPQARFRVFSAATSLIRGHAVRDPLLIILEDLHAAEEPALLLLKFLARELPEMRVLVLGTYRAEDVLDRPRCGAILDGLPVGVRIVLDGLRAEEVDAYLESTVAPRPNRAVVSRMHEISGGNPLFLQELVRLSGADLGAGLPALDWIARSTSPLRDAIRRHLRPLSPRAREVLAASAVIGSVFELLVLREMLGWSDDELLECIGNAVAAGVVSETSPRNFVFCHALIRELLLHELPAADRRRLHERAAQALETLGRGEQPRSVAAIAYHLVQSLPAAGAAPRAVDYLVRAAEGAAMRTAHEEARSHYRKALEVLDQADLPSRRWFEVTVRLVDAERLCGAVGEAQARGQLAIDWARSKGTTEDLVQAVLAFAMAHPDTGVLDDALMRLLEEVLAVLPESAVQHRVVLLSRLSVLLSFTQGDNRCIEVSNQALALARTLDDQRSLGQALSGRIFCLLGRPHAESAGLLLEAQDEALALARTCTDADIALDLEGWGYTTLLHHGQIERATQELVRYEQLSRAARRPLHDWYVMSIRTARAIWMGDFATGERLAGETLDYGTRMESPAAESYFGGQLFQIRRDQGRIEELLPVLSANAEAYPTMQGWRAGLAIAYLETGNEDGARSELDRAAHDDFDDLVHDMHWLAVVSLYGEVSAALNHRGSAKRLYELLRPMEPRVATTGAVAVVLGFGGLVLGQLALTLGDEQGSAGHFKSALALATRMGAQPWMARAELGLARAFLTAAESRSLHSEARALIGRARMKAARLGLTAIARQIDALARVESPGPPPAAKSLLKRAD